MAARNGEEVESRLRECSLYDPQLKLAVYAPSGDPAAYGLFWFDHVTGVGMLEPRASRKHTSAKDWLEHWSLPCGLNRLVARGARRLKVGFDTDAGRSLYLSSGFTLASTIRRFSR